MMKGGVLRGIEGALELRHVDGVLWFHWLSMRPGRRRATDSPAWPRSG